MQAERTSKKEKETCLSHQAPLRDSQYQKNTLRWLLLDKTTARVAEENRANVRVDQAWTQARLPERPKLGFMKLVLRDPDRREPIGDVPMMLSSSTVWPSTAKRCRISSVTFWKLAVSCSS